MAVRFPLNWMCGGSKFHLTSLKSSSATKAEGKIVLDGSQVSFRKPISKLNRECHQIQLPETFKETGN